MSGETLSIEGDNEAAAIRDAVLGSIPEDLHGTRGGFEVAYEVGQEARLSRLTPEEAAEMAKRAFDERSIDCVKNSGVVEKLVPLSRW